MNSVSLIIPSYSRQNILLNTLNEFSKQTFQDFEIIVVDQSKNKNKQLKNYQFNQIKYKYFQIKEIGLPNARNYGATKAMGDILIFVDDDIIPDISLVENYIKLFDSLGLEYIIGGRIIEKGSKIFKESKNLIGGKITYYGKTLKNFDTKNDGFCDWVAGGNFAVCRKLYQKAGGFDKKFIGTSIMEDSDFSFAAKKNGAKIYYSHIPVIEHLRIPTGGLRQKQPSKGMYYRAHNTVYFFKKYNKIRFLLFVFIYLHAVVINDLFNKRHSLTAFLWTWKGFFKAIIK